VEQCERHALKAVVQEVVVSNVYVVR
jgi:hypothetical protein